MRKNIFLDFDGVLADSANECIESSAIIFEKMSSQKIPQRAKDIAVKYRYLVMPPREYKCLIQAVLTFEDEVEIPILFNKYKEKLRDADAIKFEEELFYYRDNLINSISLREWFNMNLPTLFFKKIMSMKLYNSNLFIISRKNENAIQKWICGGNMEHKFKVYGSNALKKFSGSKYELIQNLQQLTEFSYPGIFVDDFVQEISAHDWQSINVTPHIAGWGYNDMPDNSEAILLDILK